MGCKNNKHFKQSKKLYVNTNVVFHKHFNREEKQIFKIECKDHKYTLQKYKSLMETRNIKAFWTLFTNLLKNTVLLFCYIQ